MGKPAGIHASVRQRRRARLRTKAGPASFNGMGRGAVGPLGQPHADYTLSHCPGGGGGVTVVVVVMKEGT